MQIHILDTPCKLIRSVLGSLLNLQLTGREKEKKRKEKKRGKIIKKGILFVLEVY